MTTAGGSEITPDAGGEEIQPSVEGVLWDYYREEINASYDEHDLTSLGNWGKKLRGWIQEGHADPSLLALCYEYAKGAYDMTRIGLANDWWLEQIEDLIEQAQDQGVPEAQIVDALLAAELEMERLTRKRAEVLA
jgi:hypothetical protein